MGVSKSQAVQPRFGSVECARLGGLATALKLKPEQRSANCRYAAQQRWAQWRAAREKQLERAA